MPQADFYEVLEVCSWVNENTGRMNIREDAVYRGYDYGKSLMTPIERFNDLDGEQLHEHTYEWHLKWYSLEEDGPWVYIRPYEVTVNARNGEPVLFAGSWSNDTVQE